MKTDNNLLFKSSP